MLKITKIRFYETFGRWFGPYVKKTSKMFACTFALKPEGCIESIYSVVTHETSIYKNKMDWSKRKLLRALFRTPTWASFHCFGTPVSLAAMTSCENAPHNEKPKLLRTLKRPLVHIHASMQNFSTAFTINFNFFP